MAIDVSQLTDYSWADIAKAAKGSLMASAAGGAEYRMPDGRMLRRLSEEEAERLYNTAIAMQNAESGTDGGGIALAQFGEPQ